MKKLRQLEDTKTAAEADGGRANAGHSSAESRHRKKLVEPTAKRAAAQWMAERFGLSQRRVCRVLAIDRTTLRYRSRRQDDAVLRMRIREIAARKRRYGCPRIYVRLRRAGWTVNHKKVERLYDRNEGLALRRRRRKKAAAVPRVAFPKPTPPGRCDAMDFVHDRLVTGRRFKCLTMIDPCSKEVPVIEIDVSIGGARVCRILDRLFTTRPLPDTLILANGPEFAGDGLGGLGCPAWCAPPLHSAREAGSERLYRELQWQVSR